jgi:hypothetical protein
LQTQYQTEFNMATSGSVDFNQTRNEIIKDALVLLGVIGADETIHEADQALSARFLNKMVKSWDAQGIHLWTATEATLFLADEVAEYDLSNASGSARWSDTVVDTTLSAAEAASQTVISVTTSTGMTAADIVGIVADDDTVHWSTIASVDSSTQITIDDATVAASASGNRVYSFTTRANRPLKIHSVRRRSETANDVPLIKLSREEYFDLPAKDSVGTPVQFFYDPQLTTGKLYLWPKPSDPEVRLKMTYQRQLEDFDAAGNNPDFPQEWLECLTYNLAVRLAPAFGKDQKAIATLAPMAVSMLESIKSYDNEVTSISISPNYEGGYN